jgi:uncharacterized protein
MKELLEYIVKSIVNQPDSVSITERESVDFPGLTILSVSVAEDDKGIVIGKRGRTINAIRDIMSINAIRSNKRVRIIVEEEDKGNEKSEKVEEKKTEDVSDEQDEDIFEDNI